MNAYPLSKNKGNQSVTHTMPGLINGRGPNVNTSWAICFQPEINFRNVTRPVLPGFSEALWCVFHSNTKKCCISARENWGKQTDWFNYDIAPGGARTATLLQRPAICAFQYVRRWWDAMLSVRCWWTCENCCDDSCHTLPSGVSCRDSPITILLFLPGCSFPWQIWILMPHLVC